MKIVLPILCSLLLIGCGDSKPAETTTAPESSVPVEVNQTAVPETNLSSAQPATQTAAAVPTTAEAVRTEGGTLFAQKCVSCHGAKGEKAAMNKSQIIADFSEAQIKEALKGYQNGTYGKDMKAVMQGQAKGLNDAQIDALAKYISTL